MSLMTGQVGWRVILITLEWTKTPLIKIGAHGMTKMPLIIYFKKKIQKQTHKKNPITNKLFPKKKFQKQTNCSSKFNPQIVLSCANNFSPLKVINFFLLQPTNCSTTTSPPTSIKHHELNNKLKVRTRTPLTSIKHHDLVT
jgi:hypothetical protein